MKNHPILKHVFSLRTALLALLLGTALFYALHPEYLRDGEKFDVEQVYSPISAERYILLPHFDHPVIMAFTMTVEGLKAHSYDFKTGFKPEISLPDVEGDIYPYWNEETGSVLLVLRNTESHYFQLLSFSLDERQQMSVHRQDLWKDELIDALQDSVVVVRGETFGKVEYRRTAQGVDVEHRDDGYHLVFGEDVIKLARRLWPLEVDDNPVFGQAAALLQNRTGKPFDNRDIYRIIQTLDRNSWYQDTYPPSPPTNASDLPRCGVIGRLDCNGDGRDEYLILANGDRFIPAELTCWDSDQDSVLWSFTAISIGLDQPVAIADFDSDGRDEVAFGTPAPGNESSPNWFDTPHIGQTYFSYFYVLDDDGSIYNWGDHKGVYRMGTYGTSILGYYSEAVNKTLVLKYTDMDKSVKPFHVLDMATGVMDSLDATYITACVRMYDDDQFIVWDFLDGVSRGWRFSETFQPTYLGSQKVSIPPKNDRNAIVINGQTHTFCSRGIIYDSRLNFVHKVKAMQPSQAFYSPEHPDTLFFSENTGHEIAQVGYLAFTPNRRMSPIAVLIISFELLLFIIYWVVRSFIMAPIESGDKGYIVLWSLFDRLFIWKLLGRASIYRLPRYIAFDKRYFSSAIKGLASDYRCIFERKLLLSEFSVYELDKVDELGVVQHLAHELKNRLHVMQLTIDQDDEDSQLELRRSLKWSFSAARTISDFSRVHTLNPQPLDLRDSIEDTAHTLMGHERFEQLSLALGETPLISPIDRHLFGMALRNLIENALCAIGEDDEVVISTRSEDEQNIVTISNPGYIPPDVIETIQTSGGWSNKREGTGVGVTVARVIIENHLGRFQLTCANRIVTATIQMAASHAANRSSS